MKILVTGAAGFIGSHLCEKLIELGHEVCGIDRFSPYYSRKLKELNASDIKEKGVKLFELDLAKDDLHEALNGVEIIYHLAAQPGISSATPFDVYVNDNIIATYRLLEVSKDIKTLKLFVNIATSSIYGKFAKSPEEKAPEPFSYYGVSKLAAEQMVLAYNRDYHKLPACSFRLYSVYGERERPEKVYPKLIKSILEGSEFTLFEGSDKHERSFTYVGDIVLGLVLAVENIEKCVGQIFNIGSDTVITTGEGIKIVESIMGKNANIKIIEKRAGDQEQTQAIIDKAKNILGYCPRVKPAEGLKKEIEWYTTRIHGKV